MTAAYVAVTVATVFALVVNAAPDYIPTQFVLANAASVGVHRRWLPMLASLKIAGASGLVGGLIGLHVIGMAAGLALVVFFIGAVTAHVRAGALSNVWFAVAYLGLAIASTLLMGTQI